MENQVGIATRAAFISYKVGQFLADITEHYSDTIYPSLSAIIQDDRMMVLVKSYCQTLGAAAYEKTNLFALKRLLAECGIQAAISADLVSAICADHQPTASGDDFERSLIAFAQSCNDPYAQISVGMRTFLAGLQRLTEIRVLEKAKETVRCHLATLARKRRQMLIYDDYGVPDRRRWNDELKHFVTNVIAASLTEDESPNLPVKEILSYIEEISTAAEPLPEDDGKTEKGPDPLPRDYELHCSTVLERQGWSTRLTAITGDQGVDIIAERNGLKLVVQCKHYSSPVGNKAVQEAHAGKDFLKADIAVVVSNADFTPSAKELAASLSVLLLHHAQLEEFDRVLFLNAFRERL